MASTINSDNGVSSGSAGLKSSADSSGVLQLQTNGTAAVTVDTSQNVGIGQTSPSYKLEVVGGGVNTIAKFSYSTNQATWINSYGAYGGIFGESAGNNGFAYLSSANKAYVVTNGNIVGTFDSSGNLGLGVTPSAWNSVYKGLQIGLGASIYGRTATSTAAITSNAFVNSGGNFQYINSDGASYYLQSGGVHYWTTAASGTAGNAITFTTAMTLDASGNLGVGVTSVASDTPLHVKKTGDNAFLKVESSAFSAILNLINGGATEVSTIRASGSNNVLTFQTGTTERARIDSSGRFYVGLTSPINGSQTAVSGDLTAVNGVSYQSTATTGTATYAAFYYNGTNKGTITGTSTAASYNTGASDYRLKENITDLTGGLEKINLLRPVSFTWIDSKENDYGFIAHELQSVIPQAISGEKDAVDENGIPKYQSIFPAPAQMIATLVKAIQEQNQLIQQLQADVAALKGASA